MYTVSIDSLRLGEFVKMSMRLGDLTYLSVHECFKNI